jgi:hypothetical protein
MTHLWLQRSFSIAGFALVAAAVPMAMLAASPAEVSNQADCPVGWQWDFEINQCVNVPNPVLGPVGPVGVGGVDPVLGPAGPVGVGGLGPVAGPVGPVGVGGVGPVVGPVGPVGVGPR